MPEIAIDWEALLQPPLAVLRHQQSGTLPEGTALLAGLASYCALVRQYNRAAQLTGLNSNAQVARELVVESLRLLSPGRFTPGAHVLDIGSGNGSPVIPLALASPEADFFACETREKRLAFLETCQYQLRLTNLTILSGPVEKLRPKESARWDVVTSRAFAPLDRLLPLAVKLLGPGGELRGFLGEDAQSIESVAEKHRYEVLQLLGYNSEGRARQVYQLRRKQLG